MGKIAFTSLLTSTLTAFILAGKDTPINANLPIIIVLLVIATFFSGLWAYFEEKVIRERIESKEKAKEDLEATRRNWDKERPD